MATERENIPNNKGLGVLSVREYDLAGNKFRAYSDGAGSLVFVVDDTLTPDKPNALLVINSDDGRKWDDILANDYGVSLEMVRPKKDNKYQKLDIEYVGLDEYEDLIRDYEAGLDIADALNALVAYRMDAAVRIASDRLQAAEEASENARDTIARANDTIADAQARLKSLRTKLSQQKKSVGREPTKQSAAKILRTESQIDAIKDKQSRARRRLDNARRRLVAAEEDAEIARAIVARHTSGADKDSMLPATAAPRAVATIQTDRRLPAASANVAPAQLTTDIVTEEPIEQKAEEMAEEVKPLFDTDPEILDEEIAFKPIDFEVKAGTPMGTSSVNSFPRVDDYDAPAQTAPLSFTPPMGGDDFRPIPVDVPQPAPVLDTITSVEMPADAGQPMAPTMYERPVSGGMAYDDAGAAVSRPMSVSPAGPVPGMQNPGAVARPVSPVAGAPATPVDSGNSGRRPTFLYYILLILLIALSIFTLWLYQQKNSDTVPDLVATAASEQQVEETAPSAEDNTPSPFIVDQESVSVTTEPEPEPIVPVVDETVPAIPVVAEPEPEPEELPEETPFLTEPEPEPEPVKPVIVNKPVYNAGSQNENMFVAAEDYDTEVVSAPAPVPAPSDVVYDEASSDSLVCDDGASPDSYGCCGDEQYTDIGDTGFACCSVSTGDCYPPMF